MLHPVFVIIFIQQKLYHGVRLVVKSKEEFTVIELTCKQQQQQQHR